MDFIWDSTIITDTITVEECDTNVEVETYVQFFGQYMVSTGSSNLKKFKSFQIRWREKLGDQNSPYLIRWTIILFGYSIRIHHWIKSDDNRFFHDHSSDLLSVVLKGKYWNVKPIDDNKNPNNNEKYYDERPTYRL